MSRVQDTTAATGSIAPARRGDPRSRLPLKDRKLFHCGALRTLSDLEVRVLRRWRGVTFSLGDPKALPDSPLVIVATGVRLGFIPRSRYSPKKRDCAVEVCFCRDRIGGDQAVVCRESLAKLPFRHKTPCVGELRRQAGQGRFFEARFFHHLTSSEIVRATIAIPYASNRLPIANDSVHPREWGCLYQRRPLPSLSFIASPVRRGNRG
jgi:hypothetical protein